MNSYQNSRMTHRTKSATYVNSYKSVGLNRLASVDASDLLVYKNKAALDKKEEPLRSSRILDGL